MPDALAATAARLRALMPGFPDTYDIATVPPDGPCWVRLDAVPVADWCADARERNNPHRLASLAAMSVGGALVHAVLARVTAGSPSTPARGTSRRTRAVHRAAAGHIDRVAALRLVAWVVAGDEAAAFATGGSAAGSPARDVPGRGRVGGGRGRRRTVGARRGGARAESSRRGGAAGCGRRRGRRDARPLLRDVRAATRFGLVPLWNAAADTVRLTAEFVPRYAGKAPRPTLAPALIDALVAHGAPVRGRGSDEPLPGRAERVPVRAACCLAFRTDPPVARPSDALCTTCPLLPAPERAPAMRPSWTRSVQRAGEVALHVRGDRGHHLRRVRRGERLEPQHVAHHPQTDQLSAHQRGRSPGRSGATGATIGPTTMFVMNSRSSLAPSSWPRRSGSAPPAGRRRSRPRR